MEKMTLNQCLLKKKREVKLTANALTNKIEVLQRDRKTHVNKIK